MNYKSQFHKVSSLGVILKLETVQDKLGNIRFMVTSSNGSFENVHYVFTHLSSALDFIENNYA